MPSVQLPDQDGTVQDINALSTWRVLYFYPRDLTPGCTIEAAQFERTREQFDALGAQIFGISADTVDKHKKFCEKKLLGFTLLSDESHEVCEAFGVWQKKKFMGREFMGIARTSFLIAPDGTVAKVYDTVKPLKHAEEVLADLSELV